MRTQLHQIVADMARSAADAPALTFKDDDADLRRALAARYAAFAAGLRRLGLGRGERVASTSTSASRPSSRSSAPRPPAACSCRSTRCCAPQQVGYILDDCGVRVLVTSAERLELLARRARALPDRSSTWSWSATAGDPRTSARRASTPGTSSLRAGDDRARARTGSTSTWRRSSTRRAAPGSRRASCSPTATCSSAARASASTSGTTSGDGILAALPLSFDAGLQPADDRRSRSAPTSCWSTTCCRATWSGSAPKHRVTGLTCVPPLWIQLADQTWPAEATAAHALLRQHRRPDAEGDARPAAGDLPQARARTSCTG